VLSSLIICWFGSLVFTFFPKELNDLISIVMLIPLIIILKKLNPQWKWYTIVLFVISYLLFFIVLSFDYTYLPQRLLLIFINVVAIIVLLRMRRQVNLTDYPGKLWKAFLHLVIRFFLLLSVVSLIANLFGSIRLAQLLIYAILGTIITLYTLKAAISLSESFVYLLLMGPLIKYSYILREDSELVLKKMDTLFRFLGFSALVIIILDLFNIRKEVYHAALSIVNYPLEIGSLDISLGNILAFFVTILIATWLSSLIRYILEKETFPRIKLKPGMPNTILLMIRFTFVLLGIVFAFAAAGIQMDKLTILMGALGVGIGFGLQNIINNFVSGIILALERPIKIGDKLEIPGVSGIVKDIGVRASTVRTWDGSDIVIPNGELISNKLTNWTLYDRTRRIIVEIRVPFDTDMESLSELLLDTAKRIPEVMKKPSPYLYFKGLGTSTMEINLYCWISNNDNFFSYSTSIRKVIFKTLKDAGYDIPVPQQDVRINQENASPGKQTGE
jgi:small-conductance mechanosensitive channel